jgi:hypothetical protein
MTHSLSPLSPHLVPLHSSIEDQSSNCAMSSIVIIIRPLIYSLFCVFALLHCEKCLACSTTKIFVAIIVATHTKNIAFFHPQLDLESRGRQTKMGEEERERERERERVGHAVQKRRKWKWKTEGGRGGGRGSTERERKTNSLLARCCGWFLLASSRQTACSSSSTIKMPKDARCAGCYACLYSKGG